MLLAIAFLSGLAIVTLVQLPANSLLWREIQNTGHSFAFGMLALVAFFLLRTTGLNKGDKPASAYLGAFALCLATGIAVELVQFRIGRDADILDVLRNGIGSISFLGIYAAFDPKLAKYRKKKRGLFRGALVTGSLLLLLAGLLPLIGLSASYLQRDRAFPVLIDFDADWNRSFISTQDSRLQLVPAPPSWQQTGNKRAGLITLYPAQYPGLALHDPVGDWTGYSYLSFHIYSENPQEYTLTLRIHDRQHNWRYEDRFNTRLSIQAGDNLFHIPLEKIRSAPKGREMDMTAISNMTLFAVEPEHPLQFYLSNVRLERD